MQQRCIQSVIMVSILSVLIISGITEITAINPPPEDLNTGPYVTKIVYKVIENEDQRILALQAGETEMYYSFFDSVHLPALEADPDINTYFDHRNGYGQITINCRDYPLNISGFRRAFAFAYNKTKFTTEIMGGFSILHDSVVPKPNNWCVEDDFDWNYYSEQVDIGNQILDDLGFEINVTTGFRDAPNGEPFDIVIEYAYLAWSVDILGIEYETPYEIAKGAAQIGVDALTSLHIDASLDGLPQYGIDRIHTHGNYDMIFYSTNFDDYDVDWLGYDYWSEYADVDYQNPSNFRNDTYDSWRYQLLTSTTYEEVYEAAAEMQKILQYNVPILVVLENEYLQAYRNDQFNGQVEDLNHGIAGFWTTRNVMKLDRTFGGTVPIAISEAPDSFNIYKSDSMSSTAIFDNLYPSLFKQGPDLNPIPDLAETLLTETHDDNPAVPDGHTRFTIDIIQNATWSDGTPLTASDVAFTYSYQYESAAYGNPAGLELGNLVAAYAPTQYRAILEFNTKSYWHFGTFAYDYIIPEHIFNNEDGVGYDNWESWNPVFNSSEPHVTCGPFSLTDFEDGEFYELTINLLFHHGAEPFPVPHFITSEGNITYELGSLGNEIVWMISGDDYNRFSIQMNGIERESGPMAPSEIRYNVDGLWVGTYTFTLIVNIHSVNSMSNSVQVTVVNPTGIFPLNPLKIIAISISSVSAVIVLAVTISIYRKKRIREIV